MNRKAWIVSVVAASLVGLILGTGINSAVDAQQQPPTPQANPAPAPPHKARRPRGLRPTREHWLALQKTRDPKFVHYPRAVVLPPQYGVIPTQLSMWGNDVNGDCVSAEGAFAIAAASIAAGQPEIFIPEANVISWARQHGDLNGAELPAVMQQMAQSGLVDASGKAWPDGPYTSVDYTTYQTVCDAIYTTGPVKIGVASAQFDNFQQVGNQNGWIMTGLSPDASEDHCVSLSGFGTMQALCAMMGVQVPGGVSPTAPAYLMFTWSTVGIIDAQSMVNVTGEAYVRNPTVVGVPLPLPTPTPNPTPTPTPTPGTFTYTLGPGAPAGAAIDASGNFTWSVPATQAPGTVTIAFTAASGGQSATGSFQIVVSAAAGGAIVIAPIPAQSATAGTTFSLGLGQYVSQGTGTVKPSPQAAPHAYVPPVPVPGVTLDFHERDDATFGREWSRTASSVMGVR